MTWAQHCAVTLLHVFLFCTVCTPQRDQCNRGSIRLSNSIANSTHSQGLVEVCHHNDTWVKVCLSAAAIANSAPNYASTTCQELGFSQIGNLMLL